MIILILRQNKSTLNDCSTSVQENFRNVFSYFLIKCFFNAVKMERMFKDSASYNLMVIQCISNIC